MSVDLVPPDAYPPVRLVMALHFHQPVGNFDTVFQDAVRLSYRPIVEHFERHPGVLAAFHVSGCLLEWLEKHDRALLDRLVALVGAGQVEPLGGGFYEPILPAIPRVDALDQIGRMAAWWRKRAGVTPKGAWIAERVWEPALAELLAEAGVEYTILDDQHLRFAGLLDERFEGVFVTERAGRGVAFFPSDFALRYLIPFRPIEAVRLHLQNARVQLATGVSESPVLTYGDDAEKFGLWPKTHAWVYGEKWLEQFFALLEEEKGPARAVLPRDILAASPPTRKVYVPNASYTEMLEWALPAASVGPYGAVRDAAIEKAGAESARAFVRGSLWDMFLARYPEADHLHKHVLWSSARARRLRAGTAGRSAAITAALRAECNCAYWHGLFGGIYYNHLRHALYHEVLEADARLRARERRPVVVEVTDFDGDRETEVILRAGRLQAFFRPSDAGVMAELDDLGTRFNVTNVISRWRESYHTGADLTHAGAGEGGVASPHEQAVGISAADLAGRAFDTLPLRSLRDFSALGVVSPEELVRFDGMHFARGRPDSWQPSAHGFTTHFRRPGFACERTVTVDADGALLVSWSLDEISGWTFGTLLTLSLLTPRDKDRSRVVTGAPGMPGAAGVTIVSDPGDPMAQDDVASFALEDRVFGFRLVVEAEPAVRLVAAPIETLQRSEVRFESAYQGTIFALCWRAPGGSEPPSAAVRRPRLRLRFEDARPGKP